MLWLPDFFSLFFPRICACCGNSLWKHEEVVCTSCIYHLPKTGFHLVADNPAARTFWGRTEAEGVASFLWFSKGGRTQRLIHQLKYKGRKDVGSWLGEQYGHLLRDAMPFCTAEVIIPVPLHKKKLMKRGFNQSEVFAEGLSRSMRIPTEARVLIRSRSTPTQTRKSRFSRWENVSEIFAVRQPEKLEARHVLLVDDVITTGATLEACIAVLRKIPGIRVSVASIAYTSA